MLLREQKQIHKHVLHMQLCKQQSITVAPECTELARTQAGLSQKTQAGLFGMARLRDHTQNVGLALLGFKLFLNFGLGKICDLGAEVRSGLGQY